MKNKLLAFTVFELRDFNKKNPYTININIELRDFNKKNPYTININTIVIKIRLIFF